jgi:hypothetical protein
METRSKKWLLVATAITLVVGGGVVYTLKKRAGDGGAAYYELEKLLSPRGITPEQEALVQTVGNEMASLIEAKDDLLKNRIEADELRRRCETFVSAVQKAAALMPLEQQKTCGFKAIEVVNRVLGNTQVKQETASQVV